MAFSVVTQSDTYPIGNKFAVDFLGTAGAASNAITVNFIVDANGLLGGPGNTSFTQSAGVVTVSGLTNTQVYTLQLRGATTL